MRTRRVVLVALLLVYVLNYIDRQLVGILAEPIKADLGLTDTQIGVVGGPAFALMFSILAIPLALLADRRDRSWVIAGSLAVWSLFTALCGLVTGFWQLFLCRVGVGTGEAGGVAPSYALVSDHYPVERHALASAIYSLGVPFGLAAGALLGGYIGQWLDWRITFLVIGAAGVVLAPLVKAIVRDPPRAAAAPMPVRRVFGVLAAQRSFWLLTLAASAASVAAYGISFWTPAFLMRTHGLDLVTMSRLVGVLILVGGTAGVLAGGWLTGWLGRRDRGFYAILPAIAWLVSVPLFALGLLASTPLMAAVFFVLPSGLNILWLGPAAAAIQHTVPREMRATATATFLCIQNLIGLGVGTLAVGVLSDTIAARYGGDALRYSLIAELAFYVLAAVSMLVAVKPLRREWRDDF